MITGGAQIAIAGCNHQNVVDLCQNIKTKNAIL
jgi:hypothetical protein